MRQSDVQKLTGVLTDIHDLVSDWSSEDTEDGQSKHQANLPTTSVACGELSQHLSAIRTNSNPRI